MTLVDTGRPPGSAGCQDREPARSVRIPAPGRQPRPPSPRVCSRVSRLSTRAGPRRRRPASRRDAPLRRTLCSLGRRGLRALARAAALADWAFLAAAGKCPPSPVAVFVHRGNKMVCAGFPIGEVIFGALQLWIDDSIMASGFVWLFECLPCARQFNQAFQQHSKGAGYICIINEETVAKRAGDLGWART